MDYKELNKKLKHVPNELDKILENLKSSRSKEISNITASNIPITDPGNLYNSTDVENALREVATKAKQNSSYNNAINISIKDSSNLYEATNVEEALREAANKIKNIESYRRASNISIEDTNNFYEAGNVEEALKEVAINMRKGSISILNYCTVDSEGKIKNQDAQIQKCFNENRIIDLRGTILIIDSKITLPSKSIIRDGLIMKGNVNGYLSITGICTIENVAFYQTNFDIRQALLHINNAANIKLSKCTFSNSSIDLDENTEHWHVSISDCNFDCDNKVNATTTDKNHAVHAFPQNTAIRAMMSKGRIVNLSVTDCKISAGRCFIAATTTKSLIITNNIIMGNANTQSNGLDLIHLDDVNSVIFENNIVKEYITSANLFYATNNTRGIVSSNIFKDSSAECIIRLDKAQHMNIIGNEICKTIDSYKYVKGIFASGGSFYKIEGNNISSCMGNGISVNDGNYHSMISNNTLAFNNQYSYEWNPSLLIAGCYCVTCIGNYINLEVDQQIQKKPAFHFCDNNFGLVTGNHFRGYTDIGRNNDTLCENSANKWFV